MEKQTSNACGQTNCASLFSTPSIRLKGTRSDALDLDLYGDNLKMFNLAGRKTWPALGHDLDAHVLENVYERQVKKFNTHEACDDLRSAEHFWKRNREATNDKGLWLIAFSNSNSKPNWLLKKRPIKRQQQQHTLQKTAEEQGTHCRSWMSKGPCKCLFGHDTVKKGKSKKNRSRSPIKKIDDSAERQCVRKTGQSPSGKEHRHPCFNCTTGTHCHDRECDCWHPPALETRQEK